jgi:ABC-2 type transport system ATP-binding protein
MGRTLVLTIAVAALAFSATPAAAEEFSVKTLSIATMVGPDDDIPCTVLADLYKPNGASPGKPAPAILTTNGFGGSKNDQATFAKEFAKRGYVVLSYSGLGFGGSGCKITLDDRDYDGKAGSQLVTFLGGGKAATDGTKVDYVKQDSKGSDGKAYDHDPRVGMIGGSYGGQIQFAIAGIDPRLDTIIPIITWNDLSYSLAPNNTSFQQGVSYLTPGIEKVGWVSLFFALGAVNGVTGFQNDPSRIVGCPNFDDRACASKIQLDATGAPNDATMAFSRHASVVSFMDKIRIPTFLVQGEADTLFNLQEAITTYRSLRAQGTPVKLSWQRAGHSGPKAPGENEWTKPFDETHQPRQFLAWFDHWLKDDPAKPSLDFTYFRPWVKYEGNAKAAYARAPEYPVAKSDVRFLLSGDGTLKDGLSGVVDGALSFATAVGGAPTSYTEVSALDQTQPIRDLDGTFAQFTSAPLERDTDVVGVPKVRVRIDAPLHGITSGGGAPAELVLFFKLYDLAPDGAITLPFRLISPVRIADTSLPVDVELPGIVHRFAKGHRFALTVAQGDAAYRGNNVAGPVSIMTDKARPGVLTVPVVPEADQAPIVEAGAPRTCPARRRVTVTIAKRYRGLLRSARMVVGSKRVGAVKRGGKSARIRIAGRRAVKVKIVMKLRNGKTVTETRRIRACKA